MYRNKIYSKTNLFAFDLKPWISRKLVVLITGVNNEITQEEKKTIDWIIPPLRTSYLDMVARQFNCKIVDLSECIALMSKEFEVVIRPNLDLRKDGVFVEGYLPFIHIHLGHGGKIRKESAISIDESGRSVYFKSSDYKHHLCKVEGELWMGVFPFCNGFNFASEVSNSNRIHATWGSVDEAPVTCWQALYELPAAILHDYRPFQILSHAIEAKTP